MTTFVEKVLYEGQPSTSKGTLYTATGVRVNVRSISACNVAGVDGVTLNLYYKKATSRRRIHVVLDKNESMEDDMIFQMDSGDILEGDASSAVDVVITGIEVT